MPSENSSSALAKPILRRLLFQHGVMRFFRSKDSLATFQLSVAHAIKPAELCRYLFEDTPAPPPTHDEIYFTAQEFAIGDTRYFTVTAIVNDVWSNVMVVIDPTPLPAHGWDSLPLFDEEK